MLKRINSIFLISGLILILTGCRLSRIPANYAYNPGQLKRVTAGNWTEVKLNSLNITGNETTFSGELIAIQSDTLFLLTDKGLHGIYKYNINEAIVNMYKNQAGKYAAFTGLLYLPDIVAAIVVGEPGFLLIGIPWLVIGSVLTMIEGSDHSNLLKYPYGSQWQELIKFARFPQGIPPGIDRSRLHLSTSR